MLSLNFRITNPWASQIFKNIWSFNRLLTRHVCLELELLRDTDTIFEAGFQVRLNCDHAGVHCNLGLLSYHIDLNIYDTRHCDHETYTPHELYDNS